ncbi:MAG: imidazole glycerol phosphate synthase cyclase subunit [Gammaproteobacteria bacterium RIFCSPHIGHO2_12_FULL_35_23]|nr:MAG: imidazole glycerol phosphate synthase cyclase subunit [Gammaproteobacteria bacterium RIFCSPHIGHO2_12_FULL_35_23]
MLKKRIIPVQLLYQGRLVKSKQFTAFRDVGDPVSSSRVYNSQYADELIFLNIERENNTIASLVAVLDKVSEVCFMPLTLGGGIRSFTDAAVLIQQGADKIAINTVCYEKPSVLTEIAECFGKQAIVAVIDVRWSKEESDYVLFTECGRARQPLSLETHIKNCIQAGVGEILIQSIDQDGLMTGYDIQLVQRVCNISTVPVIACGGCGNYEHLKELFKVTNLSAAAAGSLFNFTDSNLIRAKAFLSNYQIPFKQV